jgi:hypothetical protein
MIRRRLRRVNCWNKNREGFLPLGTAVLQNEKAAGVFPRRCRCTNLSVFSGYSTKEIMPLNLQKFPD